MSTSRLLQLEGNFVVVNMTNNRAAVGKAEAKKATIKPAKEDAKIEGAALIGIDVRKDLDFPNWYQQVLVKGDMVNTPYM
jgi:prolyl-tRNA synthetase